MHTDLHKPVFLNELIDMLDLSNGDIGVDCTMGAGGHTSLMLDKVGTSGKIYGFDQDSSAHELVKVKLSKEISAENLTMIRNSFSNIVKELANHKVLGKVSAIAADLGVSSMHLDQAQRGFSFQKDGPLDMRMNQNQIYSAMDVVNSFSTQELIDIFLKYGDEKKAFFIANAIVKRREEKKFTRTADLAEVVKKSIKYNSKSKKNPATKVFQAIRIEVNKEMQELESLLEQSFKVLKPGGRLGIISFHSTEDRIIKQYYVKNCRIKNNNDPLLRNLPIIETTHNKLRGKIIKPFPLLPSKLEVSENIRARSAKLRVMQILN